MEKNKWYIIGGICVVLFIILVIVGIMLARRNSGDLPDDGTGDGAGDWPGDYLPEDGAGSETAIDETPGSRIKFGF